MEALDDWLCKPRVIPIPQPALAPKLPLFSLRMRASSFLPLRQATKRMASAFAIVFAALLCAVAVAPGNFCATRAQAQERGKSDPGASRVLLGQVTNRSDIPLANAVVYLKNTKNLMVKTYIADADGSYRFPALSPNVDYQVYAEHHGKRSNVKTLSSFNSRREARINLRIDE